jgi:hypothetical protein
MRETLEAAGTAHARERPTTTPPQLGVAYEDMFQVSAPLPDEVERSARRAAIFALIGMVVIGRQICEPSILILPRYRASAAPWIAVVGTADALWDVKLGTMLEIVCQKDIDSQAPEPKRIGDGRDFRIRQSVSRRGGCWCGLHGVYAQGMPGSRRARQQQRWYRWHRWHRCRERCWMDAGGAEAGRCSAVSQPVMVAAAPQFVADIKRPDMALQRIASIASSRIWGGAASELR